jgi:hypothetical protein
LGDIINRYCLGFISGGEFYYHVPDNCMNRAIKPIIASLITITIFVLLAYLSKLFLLPKLPSVLQNNLFWLGATAGATLMILAAIAQLTGISVKDLFTSESPQKSQQAIQENVSGNIISNVSPQENLNMIGDILQSSKKVVVEHANVVNVQDGHSAEGVDKLIRDIQASLYGDDKQLPYALTLCLDLCQQLGLLSKYELWIRKELNGYDNHEGFQKSFPNEQAFGEWMQQYADHRVVKTYVKFSYKSRKTGQMNIDNLPFESLLIGFPVAEIIRKLEEIRNNPNQEFEISLKALGQGILDNLKSRIKKFPPPKEITVPEDLIAYYKSSDLERLLNGIRNLVLSLLTEARSLQGE